MTLSIQSLASIAIELQSGLTQRDRFQRLINSLRRLLDCDASALLRFEGQQFRPLAIDGLTQDVLGRRFALDAHPRLEAIARAGGVVRFPADSDLPDPYDGLIPGHDQLKVHACIGLPLFADQDLIGALTFDSLNPLQFDRFSDEELRLISALAAGALNNALLVEALERQALSPLGSTGVSSPREHDEIIGLSPVMQQLRQEISIVAGSELNVLITGETGVGKELVVRAIHQGSARAANPLVYLNCAALPESVAESELFGHVKGAFTGAIQHRAGKFEMADNGTLFLDEIGELSLSLQAKLLRVIQYGDLQRVGDDRVKRVSVRILAATNRDLKQAAVEGMFRLDLYHRLSVFPLAVPPLRERVSDIALLAGYFCERCRIKLGLMQLMLSALALWALEHYSWPGNIRELEHSIYRAAILARAAQNSSELELLPAHFNLKVGALPTESFDEALPDPLMQADLTTMTQHFQRSVIQKTLVECGMNWAATARKLNLDSGNLHRLAKRLNIK
ncbi:nitric oxide reductase transcriptional regulator NorR [Pseudomonas lundensis]|uniref:nitric oxide reductase transcriptional regulator NorR n=1 Tax=Serratia proteamaculans TaxID=28151 RepID=UPI002980A3ED|nr:nitric oxide reductase transcriptional regulator NorR [Serratia proteamaculans]MDW5498775.1 nitric oxide reductase transcriptional regulator NorR [Serratia proteamaculans]MDW5503832.1 nitric oxide reductase transcriptional regulator NorR [Pseudomonas lundensis]